MLTRILIVLSFTTTLAAQDPPALAEAKAIDKEIQKLPDLPAATRDAAFREMLRRIRKEPKQYRLVLISNLAVSAGEVGTESATLQETADLLIEELRDVQRTTSEPGVASLAELAFYYHIKVSLDDPRYRAELAKLEDLAEARAHADFALADTNGKLRGKAVLVNIWATWCPPCRRELADFQALHDRFADQGLLVLAVTEEDADTVKRFLADHPVPYPVLLDPGDVAKKAFLVNGIPHRVRDLGVEIKPPGVPPSSPQTGR